MNTILDTNAKKLSLGNLIILQDNSAFKKELLLGLANALSASVENALDKMMTT